MRQAISHAVNKQEIIDIVLLGLGQEATGPYKPGTWAYNPDVKRYPFDQARAQALLAEAGWSAKGPDGVLDEGREAVRLHAHDQPGEQDARAKCAPRSSRRTSRRSGSTSRSASSSGRPSSRSS